MNIDNENVPDLSTQNETPGNILPRPDLREPAFRRYEKYIAMAARAKSITVSFSDFPVGEKKIVRNPHTFVCRFSDAKLGYSRYGYLSNVIPKGFDVRNLRARELDNGSVLIENHAFKDIKEVVLDGRDHSSLSVIIANLISRKIDGPVRVMIHSKSDMDFLRAAEAQALSDGGEMLVVGDMNERGIVELL